MKTEILLLLTVCSLVQCIPDLAAMCSQIEKVDCLFDYVQEGDETVCASNNQTYSNFCFYSRVRCRFPSVHVIAAGPCEDFYRTTPPTITKMTTATTTLPTTPKPTTLMVTLTSSPPTTPPTTPGTPSTMPNTTTPSATPSSASTIVQTTIDHVKESFCRSKETVACPTALDPVCASDKTFYLNTCEFSKAACDDPTLVIKEIAFCTEAKIDGHSLSGSEMERNDCQAYYVPYCSTGIRVLNI